MQFSIKNDIILLMSTNNFPRVLLNKNEEKEIQQGYPWVFDNEISHIKYRKDEKSEWKTEPLKEALVEDGSAVEIYTKAGGFLGSGVLNRKSKIAIRLIGTEHADVIENDLYGFWEKRISKAYDIRKTYYSETSNQLEKYSMY